MSVAVGFSGDWLAAVDRLRGIAVDDVATGVEVQVHDCSGLLYPFCLFHFGLVGLGGAEAPPC